MLGIYSSLFARENNTNTLTIKSQILSRIIYLHISAYHPRLLVIVASRDQHYNKVENKHGGYEFDFNPSVHITSVSKLRIKMVRKFWIGF